MVKLIFVLSFLLILLFFPWCASTSSGTGLGGGQRAEGSLQRAASRGLRTVTLDKMYTAMIYIGRMRV